MELRRIGPGFGTWVNPGSPSSETIPPGLTDREKGQMRRRHSRLSVTPDCPSLLTVRPSRCNRLPLPSWGAGPTWRRPVPGCAVVLCAGARISGMPCTARPLENVHAGVPHPSPLRQTMTPPRRVQRQSGSSHPRRSDCDLLLGNVLVVAVMGGNGGGDGGGKGR